VSLYRDHDRVRIGSCKWKANCSKIGTNIHQIATAAFNDELKFYPGEFAMLAKAMPHAIVEERY